jgi:hypothetical protein
MTQDSWKPTRKQSAFLQLPYSVLEAFYAGAVGAGKSDVLMLYPIIHRFHENPNFKGLFLRRTFPELKNEIIPRSKQFFRRLGAKYNATDKVWSFESGALFFFGHCENEDDVHKYDSMQPNYVAFDELTSFSEWIYLYITLQRVRTKRDSALPAIVRSASNPGNIGHNWVRKRFIDPCPDGFKLLTGPSGVKRIYIPATIDDNPHIDPAYRKSLEALPEAEKQAKLYGNWSAYEGQVFEEFRDKKYPDEPDNALHVIEPFDIPEWWPKIIGMDWGFAPPAMTWVGYGAVSPDKRVYLYREQAWQKTKIEEWAGHVRYFVKKEEPKIIRLCKSAGQDRGQEHTILSQICTALDYPVELSDNSAGSRIAGKMLLHEYLRWRKKYVPPREIKEFDEMKAAWILRNRGDKEYANYLNQFVEQPEEDNIPKFLIFSHSPEGQPIELLPNAIKSCVYDKTNPQDVAEFPGDDPYDGIRYLIDTADRYFEESQYEFSKVQKTEALIAKLKESGDMTAFYRNARKLDNSSGPQPIRRYHRGRS